MQITYKKRLVKNLGNYESLALEIGIEDELNFELETFDEGFTRIRKLVNDTLKEEFNKIGVKK